MSFNLCCSFCQLPDLFIRKRKSASFSLCNRHGNRLFFSVNNLRFLGSDLTLYHISQSVADQLIRTYDARYHRFSKSVGSIDQHFFFLSAGRIYGKYYTCSLTFHHFLDNDSQCDVLILISFFSPVADSPVPP